MKGFEKLKQLLDKAQLRKIGKPMVAHTPANEGRAEPPDPTAELPSSTKRGPPLARQKGGDAAQLTGTGPVRGGSTADVILGLDFGTRFTKVCYRFLGDERSSVAERDATSQQGALWPSRVFVDAQRGSLHLTRTTSDSDLFELSYLKMRLKDPAAAEFGPHPKIAAFVQRGSEQALAAFFLAQVIRRACSVIIQREADRFKDRQPRWQINLSIPAQYQDDGVAETFRLTGEVALLWADAPPVSGTPTVTEIGRRFASDVGQVKSRRRVEVFPEIVAALHDFVRRPDTPEGVHGFVDVGGGTLDGCVFQLTRMREGPVINVLAASVEPLGTVAIAKKAILGLYQDLNRTIEQRIVTGDEPELSVNLPLAESETCVRSFIGRLMRDARDHSPYGTLRQPGNASLSDPTRLTSSDHFVLRCSGGGASSPWYKRTIEATHQINKQASLGIMPYSVELIAPSASFSGGLRAPFNRFVIAHGLSSPAEDLELVRCRLPSELSPGEQLEPRNPAAIDYTASKDALT